MVEVRGARRGGVGEARRRRRGSRRALRARAQSNADALFVNYTIVDVAVMVVAVVVIVVAVVVYVVVVIVVVAAFVVVHVFWWGQGGELGRDGGFLGGPVSP